MIRKKPTILDVEKLSGFSKSTISKVLRNEKYVKKTTKDKIIKVINEIGYLPDEIARSLVQKRTTNFIGVIVSDINNPFFSETVLSITEEAKTKDCEVILCNTNYLIEEEKRYIDILIRNRALGILLATPTVNDRNIDILIEKQYPFVLITREIKKLKTNIVSVDHLKSAKMAVNYLIKKGHRKIAHFTGREEIIGTINRLKGYKSALRENGIEVENDLILRHGISSFRAGYESAEDLFNNKIDATAIFASDDLVAIGAMDFFKEKNIKVPEDISIIGYDNIEMSSLNLINLTTVDQPKSEIGRLAVRVLIEQVKSDSTLKPKKYIMDSKVIERGTVKELKR